MKHGVWEAVHVLYALADNGTGMITCQTGDVHSGDVADPDAVVFQHWGFLSLCAPPIPGLSAPEAIVFKTGSSDIVVGGRSVRSGEIAGLIKQGETCVFADGSRAQTLYKLDGSITHYTTHNNAIDGRAIYTATTPTGLDCSTPWSRLTVGDLGIHGHCVRADGSSGAYFDLGSVAGLPAPFGSMGTYLSLGANLVRIEGQTIALGPDIGESAPVLRASLAFEPLLQSIASALDTIVETVAAVAAAAQPAVSAVTVGTTMADLGPASPLLLMTNAVSAAADAITAALASLPSTSTSST